MSKHNELGKKGEEIACDFLVKRGHKILATNFRFGHKEIDIVSAVDNLLVFSEVKARSSFRFGFPEEAVTPAKQTFIKEAAAFFWEQHPEFSKCRFDVISIVLGNGKVSQLKHFEDVLF